MEVLRNISIYSLKNDVKTLWISFSRNLGSLSSASLGSNGDIKTHRKRERVRVSPPSMVICILADRGRREGNFTLGNSTASRSSN